MFRSDSSRRVALILLAAAALQLGPTVPANADHPSGKEIVVLGDSFSSNSYTGNANCARATASWPEQLGRLAGTDTLLNESCGGATIDRAQTYTLTGQTVEAAKADGFGARTKLVTLQFGLNDHWQDGKDNPFTTFHECAPRLGAACAPDDASWRTDDHGLTGQRFAQRVQKVIDYIRYYAPNARIVFVGYPEEFSPGQDIACMKAFGLVELPFPRPGMAAYFDRLDSAQRQAAQILHVDFLDVRALTAGHGLCASQPWVRADTAMKASSAGIPDMFHPLVPSDTAVAQALNGMAAR